MIRSITLSPDKTTKVAASFAALARPEAGSLAWFDLSAPDEATLIMLGERFGFHPLALEDCAHADQRPKAEEYGDHLFLVTQSFQCPKGNFDELRWHELHAFLGENYLVTVHDEAIPGLEQIWKRAEGDANLLARGVDFLYYVLVDRLVDDNIPVLDDMADAIEEIEESVLARAKPRDLNRILGLKRCLVLMRKVLSPQRDMIAMLAKRGDARISDKTALYFRDIYDHLVRTVESIEANRDLLGNALEAYLSSVSQRTNEIMKALAILSAVFMPLTFITGFFGQNFEGLPFHSNTMMWAMLSSLLLAPALMMLWFKRRRWF
jgi:magnesium transporter